MTKGKPWVLMLVGLLTAGLQAAAAQTLTDADKQGIKRFIEAYAKTHVPLNTAAAAAYYTEDGLRMSPDTTMIRGRADIQKAFQDLLDQGGEIIALTLSPIEILGTRSLAYVVETGAGNARLSKNASPISATTKAVKVLKKQADGSWKIAIDIWNFDQRFPSP
jgi:ketosteroid isomerase-like protein